MTLSRNIKAIGLALVVAASVMADGLAFPKPQPSIEKAIAIAKVALIKKKIVSGVSASFMTITEIRYQNKFTLKNQFLDISSTFLEQIPFNHFWSITFSFPASGDVSITYLVLPSGQAQLLNETT